MANSIFNGKHNSSPTSVRPSASSLLLLTSDFATSVFPDSFSLTYYDSRRSAPVPLLRSGITWYTDKNVKFRNPNTDNGTLAQAFEGTFLVTLNSFRFIKAVIFLLEISVAPLDYPGTAKPPYWQKPVYELDDKNPTNNGFLNEDLIVWMREAAFPNFKKLYGVLNRSQKPFTKGLPVGNYSIDINYSILWPVSPPCAFVSDVLRPRADLFSTELLRLLSALTSASPDFPVQPFQGRKEVVLTTLTWFGGQNHFLPIAYIVTGSVVLLVAVALTVIWWKFGRNGKNMEE